MTNPCKIDTRKRNAKTWKMKTKWRSKSIMNTRKMIQKNITKNDAKMKRPKAQDPKGREGALGPGVLEEVRSFSVDSRSRFPLASNIIKKTNIRQTIKKQSPRTSGSYLARTWRAGRHGADLLIYWAQWPHGLGKQSRSSTGVLKLQKHMFTPLTSRWHFGMVLAEFGAPVSSISRHFVLKFVMISSTMLRVPNGIHWGSVFNRLSMDFNLNSVPFVILLPWINMRCTTSGSTISDIVRSSILVLVL